MPLVHGTPVESNLVGVKVVSADMYFAIARCSSLTVILTKLLRPTNTPTRRPTRDNPMTAIPGLSDLRFKVFHGRSYPLSRTYKLSTLDLFTTEGGSSTLGDLVRFVVDNRTEDLLMTSSSKRCSIIEKINNRSRTAPEESFEY